MPAATKDWYLTKGSVMVTAVENFLMVKTRIRLWLFVSGHLCCFLSSYTAQLWVITCVVEGSW